MLRSKYAIIGISTSILLFALILYSQFDSDPSSMSNVTTENNAMIELEECEKNKPNDPLHVKTIEQIFDDLEEKHHENELSDKEYHLGLKDLREFSTSNVDRWVPMCGANHIFMGYTIILSDINNAIENIEEIIYWKTIVTEDEKRKHQKEMIKDADYNLRLTLSEISEVNKRYETITILKNSPEVWHEFDDLKQRTNMHQYALNYYFIEVEELEQDSESDEEYVEQRISEFNEAEKFFTDPELREGLKKHGIVVESFPDDELGNFLYELSNPAGRAKQYTEQLYELQNDHPLVRFLGK